MELRCQQLVSDINKLQRKAKNKDRKEQRGDTSYSEGVRAKWFCYAFKLNSLQLICTASLIFKSNLELVLSIILKERELYESTHVVVEYRCLKIWGLLSFLICSLDQKLYNIAIPEILSDSSKFEKLNEDPTLEREASSQYFLCKLRQKIFLNENVYDKLYLSGSAPARIYRTPKCTNFPLVIHFFELCLVFSSIGTFNYNLGHFL